jgi:hypothetical protein
MEHHGRGRGRGYPLFEIRIGIEAPLFTISESHAWANVRILALPRRRKCRQAVSDALDVVDIVLTPFADKWWRRSDAR